MAFVPSTLTTFTRPHLTTSFTSRRPNASPRSARSPVTPRMLVIEAASTTELDTIVEKAGESLVVIDFSTTWCGPCKVIAPIFEEMSERFNDVVFVKVMGDSSDEASELMKREGIRAVPAFHFWKDGEKVEQFSGAKADAIEVAINKLK